MKQKPKIIRRLAGSITGLQLNQIWSGQRFIGFDRSDWEQLSSQCALKSRHRHRKS